VLTKPGPQASGFPIVFCCGSGRSVGVRGRSQRRSGSPKGPALRDDEVGLHAVEDRLHVHDLHATILWLMGLDHMRLDYGYKGRPERPTINEGEVCRKIAGI